MANDCGIPFYLITAINAQSNTKVERLLQTIGNKNFKIQNLDLAQANNLVFNTNHSNKKLKQNSDDWINANYNYESLRSCLVSQSNSNKYNKHF